MPQFKKGGVYAEDLLIPDDVALTLKGVSRPVAVRLLDQPAADAGLKFDYSGSVVTIQVPASKRSMLVDVVEVELSPGR